MKFVNNCNKNTYRIHKIDPVLRFLFLVFGFGMLHLPAQAHFDDNSTAYENDKAHIVTNIP